MTTTIQIHGTCKNGYERVKDAFAQNFADGHEVGAALALVVRGETVVDLWGGYADAQRTRPWLEDTIVNVYSTTKGLTATCAHRLVDQGLLDIDAPVAKYWPEFAQAGKEDLPVRYLLSHRAGLSAVSALINVDDGYRWEILRYALAIQQPWWEPGTKFGYHALTFGTLVGEVIRRISGMTVGEFFRKGDRRAAGDGDLHQLRAGPRRSLRRDDPGRTRRYRSQQPHRQGLHGPDLAHL